MRHPLRLKRRHHTIMDRITRHWTRAATAQYRYLKEMYAMPPVSDRQRQAACADLERLRRGERLVTFEGMSEGELRKLCSQKVQAPPRRGSRA